MHILIRAAMVLAAGMAGWALAKRKSRPAEAQDPHVVYLDDEDAVIDAPQSPAEPSSVQAEVLHCYRRMDPLTLIGASEVTFVLADGTEVKLTIQGEGGTHLQEGDCGMLTWKGNTFILFEKDNDEVIGGMFYAPAGEAENHE